jgi:tetratricopeptide (TPR) repeat protein
MEEEVSLRDIVNKMALHVQNASIDARVIETLIIGKEFLGKEHPFWDYKEKLNIDAWGYAKAVRSIASFHNTHGGYLIYGVKNHEKDQSFEPVGITENVIDRQRLRQEVRKYLGSDIDITYVELEANIGQSGCKFGILHIPKRTDPKVLLFVADSPRNADKKQLFKTGEAYFRDGDTCRAARNSSDWHFLHSDRPYGQSLLDPPPRNKRSYIQHMLPDKNTICPSFVGRSAIIKTLYEWLNDDFTYVKALVGDGGKGKTSIAYEFASELVSDSPREFDIVIWLTAKQRQYSGIAGIYVTMPETHYSTVPELLQRICTELSYKEEEVTDAGLPLLKRYARDALSVIRAFVVVDDVDSLETDDQKEVLATLLQIATSGSKILVTTRANYSYAADQCVVVPGLELDEYQQYVADLCSRYCVTIPTKKVRQLRETSAGSPLWTESIIRLVRQGESIDDAIDDWRGKLGEDARGAALSKEIERLAPEAKRALLVAAYLGSASLTELRQVTGYGKQEIQEYIQALQSLFLLSAPRILEGEPRFDIAPLTRTTVLERSASMAVDHTKLHNTVRSIRKGFDANATGKKSRLIGQAITQANALLKESRYEDALVTVRDTLGRIPDHPDLLLMLGICFDQSEPRQLADARNCFKKAYDKGSRKELLFNRWFEAELSSGHMIGAIEVSKIALRERNGAESEWQLRYAIALSQLASTKTRDREFRSALNDYRDASLAIEKAIALSSGGAKQLRKQLSIEIHDAMWDTAMRLDARERWSVGFDTSADAIQRGDIRYMNYRRSVEALSNWISSLDKSRASDAVKDAIFIRISRIRDLSKHRSDDEKASSWYPLLARDLTKMQERYASLTSK